MLRRFRCAQIFLKKIIGVGGGRATEALLILNEKNLCHAFICCCFLFVCVFVFLNVKATSSNKQYMKALHFVSSPLPPHPCFFHSFFFFFSKGSSAVQVRPFRSRPSGGGGASVGDHEALQHRSHVARLHLARDPRNSCAGGEFTHDFLRLY